MSKRPKTANAVMSRLRRPTGRLRDLPIWSKLGLIMLVPTLATILVGVNGLVDHIDEASNAERARTLATLSQVSGDLVDHLQNERSFAAMVLVARDDAGRAKALKLYEAERLQVEAAWRPFAQQQASLSDLPATLSNLLGRVDRDLGALTDLRTRVAARTPGIVEVTDRYNVLLGELLGVRDAAAQLAGDPSLSDQMRTAAAVARVKEFTSQRRVVGHEIIGARSLLPRLRRSFIATETAHEQAEQQLEATATPAEFDLYKKIISGPELSAATDYIDYLDAKNYIDYLDSKINADISDITFDAAQWDTAMVGYAGLIRDVETQLDKEIVSEATALHADVQRRVFIETSVLLGMLLLAILFAWLVARSMARSLRELRQGALSVAQFGLPHAVGRLRDPSLSSSLTPAQLADQIAEPLPVRSRDEFGQVTEAFNAVHLEAVRTAAEQAALRSSVSTMFVNLARRSQILVDRLIGHLDRLERGEEDPDRLAELFQLDHLATRMRRNDENLLVLAGADSTRIQREPAALIDVLRAAQSEVEHYTRIEFGAIGQDIEVSAHAVNDMVHLVAELFDNATAFSPPNSHVMVEARRVGDRTSLYVEDRGIGISPEQLRELNERLANPPMVDVAVSRMMGLVVVARLANRHGVTVELRPATAERGTVADVTLPAAVLVPRALAGRLQQGGATSFDSGPAGPPAPRPTFGNAPLALESGPSGPAPQPAYPTGRPFDPNPPTLSGGMLGARSAPAWPEPAGAQGGTTNGNGSNGSNGSNGFHGPRSNQPIPPDPSMRDESLPHRGNGYGGDADTGAFGSIPRQLPANSDHHGRNPFVPPVSAPPVPPVSAPPFGGRPVSGPPGSPISGPPMSGPPVSGRPISGPPVSGPPVPGRPISGPPVYGSPTTGSPVSGPPASGPAFGRPPHSGPPVSGPPVYGSPVVSAPPVASGPLTSSTGAHPSLVGPSGSYSVVPRSAPPVASAPPAWPPVAADRESRVVPESLSAALDMTAEIPRVRDPFSTSSQQQVGESTAARRDVVDQAAVAHEAAIARAAAAQATAAAQIAAAQAAGRQQTSTSDESRFADETMELPIFRELESAWFQTGHPGQTAPPQAAHPSAAHIQAARVQSAPARAAARSAFGGDDSPTTAIISQRYSTAEPTRSPVPQQGGVAPGTGRTGASADNGYVDNGWRTAADDGWQAARAAADNPVDTKTTAGLPKRTPMAQLVPGGVDRAGASVQRRTPEAVRGLLSAYHRGVQRGRTKDHPTDPAETPGGQQSSQAGKEHEG